MAIQMYLALILSSASGDLAPYFCFPLGTEGYHCFCVDAGRPLLLGPTWDFKKYYVSLKQMCFLLIKLTLPI